MQALTTHDWPGNIRELRNVIEHAMIMSKGDLLELTQPALPPQIIMASITLAEMERQFIQTTLTETRGRIKGADGAATRLGLNPSTLYSKMRKLGIRPPRA
jgi:DNA-binding NtrC family response regulator